MFIAFREWLERRRYRRAKASVRESMAFFGFPIDDLSDEELETGALRFAEVARDLGISYAEASASIERFAVAYRRAVNNFPQPEQ